MLAGFFFIALPALVFLDADFVVFFLVVWDCESEVGAASVAFCPAVAESIEAIAPSGANVNVAKAILWINLFMQNY